MLTAITIKNFRLFESLEVKRLGRVTLLVGKNNSGKSSFLEALLLYLNMPSPEILHDLIGLRQDHRLPSSFNQLSNNIVDRPIKHIFYNHVIPKVGEKGISIFVEKNTQKYSLEICSQKDDSQVDQTPFLMVSKNELKSVVWSKELEDMFAKNYKLASSYGMMSVGALYSHREDIQYIPTFGTPDWRAALMWDKIIMTSTDTELAIVDTLKIIESSIDKVFYVGSQFGNAPERLPIVKIKNIEEAVTLRSLGDGVTKLFHILISIANVKDGTLLIDEFENGFHWSVQEKVWAAVFDLAEKLNVQVFATTHSRDCIQAFSKVWTENEEAGAFIRLENIEGDVRAQEYTAELLSDSIETNVEVR